MTISDRLFDILCLDICLPTNNVIISNLTFQQHEPCQTDDAII
jgi:hypothetical protein